VTRFAIAPAAVTQAERVHGCAGVFWDRRGPDSLVEIRAIGRVQEFLQVDERRV
jgi:hypothetical protein